MPQTAPRRVYEVWVKRSGAPQPTDALFTVTAAGDATVGVPGSVRGREGGAWSPPSRWVAAAFPRARR